MCESIRPFIALKNLKNCILLLVLVFTVGCSTTRKRARELTLNRNWTDAHGLWLEILSDDPKDTEAISGKHKTEEEIISEKLVAIKNSRESKDMEEALNRMDALLALEAEWEYKLDFYSATYQGNEMRILWREIESRAKFQLAKKRPLKAISYISKYPNVYSAVPENVKKSIKASLNSQLNQKCLEYNTQLAMEGPRSKALFEKICSKTVSRNIASIEEEEDKYSNAKCSIKIDGLPKNMNDVFREAVAASLRESPWYSSSAKNPLIINLNGHISLNVDRQSTIQNHEYTVKIPYTVYVPTLKYRSEPYSDSEYKCVYGYGGSYCGYVNVTKYRQVSYWDTEPVTRYRDESRVYRYVAQEIKQSGVGVLKIHFSDQNGSHIVAVSEELNETNYVHNESMPNIGLRPQTHEGTSAVDWVKNVAGSVSVKLSEALKDSWKKYVCGKISEKKDLSKYSENVLRCKEFADLDSEKEIIKTWYQSTFGVSEDELEQSVEFEKKL